MLQTDLLSSAPGRPRNDLVNCLGSSTSGRWRTHHAYHDIGIEVGSLLYADWPFRRRPEETILHCLVREHLEAFLAQAEARTGTSLPGFVRDEFEAFLECGILAHGFVRVRCADCAHEKLVAFSCKRRGFCPSCGARRMAESAAHLVEELIPRVPVRQWVLSFPILLRM